MVEVKRIIVRSQGRIQIPLEVRKALGIREGSVLEMRVDEDKIILKLLAK
jgi:AbrB family looped-hinge helix DNA binding protein